MNLLVKLGPGNLNRQDERNLKYSASQRRIHSPCAAAASIKKGRVVSAFTIINKVSENKSLIKCTSDQEKKTKCADS